MKTPSLRRLLPPVALAALVAAASLATPTAHAQMTPPPANVVSLSASAFLEAQNDWLTIAFSTTRDGTEAAAVQTQLKQALDAALAEARKAARPGGQLEVQTGGFSLSPRYAPPNPRNPGVGGGITGWQGTTELIVQGRDIAAITALAGRINTLTIGRVGFSLSREAREKLEGDATAQAIARFRARADAVAKEFGMAGWSLREVSVSGDEGGGVPRPLMRVQVQAMTADAAALPAEAGKSVVTVSVSGSVQLAK
jgi:predicted secreted protein